LYRQNRQIELFIWLELKTCTIIECGFLSYLYLYLYFKSWVAIC